jgi:hypothetical protein
VIGYREVNAGALARVLFCEVLRIEEERPTPKKFGLPKSVLEVFEDVTTLYLEASMLLALQNAGKRNPALAETLGEFEKLIVFDMNDQERAKHQADLTEAIEDLKLLVDDGRPDWRTNEFATKWLARVGIARLLPPAQPPASSFSGLTSYWMQMPPSMERTIQEIVQHGPVEGAQRPQRLLRWLARRWRRKP